MSGNLTKTIIDTSHCPMLAFKRLWELAQSFSNSEQQCAVCVSTIDNDGFPTGRFVDLKSVSHDGFVFCTSYSSAKGQQIGQEPRVGLTAWWEHISCQIRVSGTARQISCIRADRYWQLRSASARFISTTFKQSTHLSNFSQLDEVKQALSSAQYDNSTSRPRDWGGYLISPAKIEFLIFEQSRLHYRKHFERSDDCWKSKLLQP